MLSGGFGTSPGYSRHHSRTFEVALHVGLGLDGVLNESGDGLVFADLGWRLDGAFSIKLEKDSHTINSVQSFPPFQAGSHFTSGFVCPIM